MYKKYLIALCAACAGTPLWGQNLNQAKELFQAGEFEKAKPAFQRLVRQAPSNAGYNFWYGACCYETGEKEKALPYLEKSAARRYIDAYRYVGKLYADLYRFDEAVENYETHLDWLVKKKRDTALAEAELEGVKRAARMFKSVEKVTVVDSFAVDKAQFLKAYHLSKESGTLSQDANITGTAYQTEMGNKALYATANEEGISQLYTRDRLIDGWSKPMPITSLNELGNVNYPFLLSDGVTLYFASDGEGSLGGYDIFVTRYDSEDGRYLRPDNIGMPFNSPANDYLMAFDELNNLGWFASDRYQPADSVCVYVFVPNASKEVYDYENTPRETLVEAATLRSIRSTWTDEARLQAGRQALAQVSEGPQQEARRGDFRFVINDSHVYHTFSDFRSSNALKLFRQLKQKQKDREALEGQLKHKRGQYASVSASGKQQLAPSILDLEQRVNQLTDEIQTLTVQVRNEEIRYTKGQR
ncbi:hypothetical protein, secreted [gut metagenome]|uniref:Tetratricopeptide repeat protein n=1 Tax=gut metagenome TaxID=749906 RepID=J9F9P1_9ZZZZ